MAAGQSTEFPRCCTCLWFVPSKWCEYVLATYVHRGLNHNDHWHCCTRLDDNPDKIKWATEKTWLNLT